MFSTCTLPTVYVYQNQKTSENKLYILLQENNTAVSSQVIAHGGQGASGLIQGHSQVTVERDLVSQAEEEDMEALLGTYVTRLCLNYHVKIMPSMPGLHFLDFYDAFCCSVKQSI